MDLVVAAVGRGSAWCSAAGVSVWRAGWGGWCSAAGRAWLGRVRGGEVVDRGAAVFACFGRESAGGAALVLGLAGGERVGDADVAGDQCGGGVERDRCESQLS